MSIEVITSKVARMNCRALVFDFDDTLYQLPISWVDYMADFARQTLADSAKTPTEVTLGASIRERSGTTLTAYMHWIRELENRPDGPSIAELRAAFDRGWRDVSRPYHSDHHLTPGIVDLIELAQAHGSAVYVLSGGDADHKRQILSESCLRALVPRDNVIGDGDGRMGTPPSKATGLRWIVAQYADSECHREGEICVAMVGDGRVDMEAAQCAGALAIGYRQDLSADVSIRSREIPAEALSLLLWKA